MAGELWNYLGYRMAFGGTTYQTYGSSTLALDQWYVLIAFVWATHLFERKGESGEGEASVAISSVHDLYGPAPDPQIVRMPNIPSSVGFAGTT
jgi:hypothetical protein